MIKNTDTHILKNRKERTKWQKNKKNKVSRDKFKKCNKAELPNNWSEEYESPEGSRGELATSPSHRSPQRSQQNPFSALRTC